jgi:hypothetical protein
MSNTSMCVCALQLALRHVASAMATDDATLQVRPAAAALWLLSVVWILLLHGAACTTYNLTSYHNGTSHQ